MSNEHQQEKFLDLPGGRVLAYDDGGNPASKTIVLFFHGVFGVGRVSRLSSVLIKHDVHFVAPTLPGWGNSSPRANPARTPYYLALAQDITVLLDHLHPGCSNAPAGVYKLYVAGGSFGTVPAQMIFNASAEVFPTSKHIVACLLLAPATPLKYHKEYAKDLTWYNYFAIGPPARYIPWQLIHRLVSVALSKKLKRPEDSEVLIRKLLFDDMEEDEKVLFEKWRKEEGMEEGQFEKDMATNMRRSVSKSWEGFIESGEVMLGDWGYTPEEMSRKPVVLVSASGDKMMPATWAIWLAKKYQNTILKVISGGHIAGVWSLDSIWEELMGIKG